MSIQMTPELVRLMKIVGEVGDEMQTEDCRMTADPIWIVYDKKKIYGMDEEHCDDFDWLDSNCDYDPVDVDNLEDEGEEKKLEGLDGYEKDRALEKMGYVKAFYIVNKEVFKTAHFTESGANAYIKTNRHNLNDPYTFVDYMHRSFQMVELRNAIKGFVKSVS